jgi:hypothetical protein
MLTEALKQTDPQILFLLDVDIYLLVVRKNLTILYNDLYIIIGNSDEDVTNIPILSKRSMIQAVSNGN